MTIASTKRDAFTAWYIVWTGAFFLLFWVGRDLDRIFNLYVFLVPLILLPGIALIVTLLVGLAVNAFRRRWRRVISIVVAPFVAAAPFLLLYVTGITTDLIRLELWKPSYAAQVGALQTGDGGPRIFCWDWGSTGGVAVPNFQWVLVYDESDQIGKPSTSWSPEWLERAEKAAKGCPLYSVLHPQGLTDVSVQHLDGHFYVAEELL
jgi:hypothetical protein